MIVCCWLGFVTDYSRSAQEASARPGELAAKVGPGLPVELQRLPGEPIDLLHVAGDNAHAVEQPAENPAAGAVGVDQERTLLSQKLNLLPKAEALLEGVCEGQAGKVFHALDSTGGRR